MMLWHWVSIALLLLISGGLALRVRSALVDGRISVRKGYFYRERDPAAFWLAITVSAVFAASLSPPGLVPFSDVGVASRSHPALCIKRGCRTVRPFGAVLPSL